MKEAVVRPAVIFQVCPGCGDRVIAMVRVPGTDRWVCLTCRRRP